MHVVLLGDSIFDNESYVPGESPVIEQLGNLLPHPWEATLLAVDGDVTADVMEQTENLPADTSHLVISCGGNDALGFRSLLEDGTDSVAEVLHQLSEARANFQSDYRKMIAHVMSFEVQTAVGTIYDSVPRLEPNEATALAIFNEIILREAVSMKIPIIDLRLICTDPADYSIHSPIEPSAAGGEKIVQVISRMLCDYDAVRGRCVVYT